MGNQNQMAPRRAFLAPEVMSCKSHWWPQILLEGPEPRPELSQGGAAMTGRMCIEDNLLESAGGTSSLPP